VADDERERVVRARLEREAADSFDLSQGLLIRALLIVIGPDEHVLMLTFHHIIMDGWSLGIVVREFSAFYRGEEASPANSGSCHGR
jgi:Condensation domain